MLDHISTLIRAKEESEECQMKNILRILSTLWNLSQSSNIFFFYATILSAYFNLLPSVTIIYLFSPGIAPNLLSTCLLSKWINKLKKCSMQLHYSMLDILKFEITFRIWQCYLIVAEHMITWDFFKNTESKDSFLKILGS